MFTKFITKLFFRIITLSIIWFIITKYIGTNPMYIFIFGIAILWNTIDDVICDMINGESK